MVRMDLLKLVDNCTKACFLSKRHSSETTCSVLSFLSRYPAIRRHRTAQYRTEHQLYMNWHINAASLWCHQYTYVHVQTRSPRNSVAIKHMRKQCVPGALSPPTPRLGTRLYFEMSPYPGSFPLLSLVWG